MKTERDSKDLLHDVLDDGDSALRSNSLDHMLLEVRRLRVARQNVRRAAVAAAVLLLAAAAWFVPRKSDDTIAGATPLEHRAAIRLLSDSELQRRLEKFAVASVGDATHRRIIMIEAQP